MKLEATLIRCRTIRQGETKSMEDSYAKAAAVCELDPNDMERIGVGEGETIKVSSRSGEVFVKAMKSEQYPHEGTVFMPLGPWANAIIDSDARCVKATIEPARDRDVLNAVELIEELYLKPKPFCYLNPKDREKVRVKENEKIRLITPRGDIFAFVKESEKIAEGEAEVRYKTYKIKAKIEDILAKRRTQ